MFLRLKYKYFQNIVLTESKKINFYSKIILKPEPRNCYTV